MVYHLFIDETGDPSLQSINQDFPIFVLCGCLISDDQYREVQANVASLKQRIFGRENVILHSRDIRKCEGVFAKLFDLSVKESFYTELNALIAKTSFTVIAVAIRKHDFIERYGKLADDPYELSLSFLLERSVMATDGNSAHTLHITAESRGRKEDETLKKRYNRLLDVGTGHISAVRFRDRIVDMRFRRKEHNDCGLQLADLCAYPIARHLLYPAIAYPAYDIVERKFRRSTQGVIAGYGLKVFP
jgi:hypothetical protein